MGPALPPWSMSGAVALAVAVSAGVGAPCGVMGTGGGGRVGGVLLVLCPGSAWGAGARANAEPWVRGHGLCFEFGLRSATAAVAGHLLHVGIHSGRCWLALALLWSGSGWPVGLECGFFLVVE